MSLAVELFLSVVNQSFVGCSDSAGLPERVPSNRTPSKMLARIACLDGHAATAGLPPRLQRSGRSTQERRREGPVASLWISGQTVVVGGNGFKYRFRRFNIPEWSLFFLSFSS